MSAAIYTLTNGSVLVIAPAGSVVDLEGITVEGSLIVTGDGLIIKNVIVKGNAS